MNMMFLSNLPPVHGSVAKLASKGGQLIMDFISAYGFLAFCLIFVGACLIVPGLLYEKYYKVGDDETTVENNDELPHQPSTNHAA